MSESELRQHPRLPFDGRAWCEHPDLTLYLPLANVSAGGVLIQTGAPLRHGQRLQLSLGQVGEGEEQVVARLEIVWVGKSRRGPAVGCKLLSFVSGQEAYSRLIARLGT